MGGRIECSLRLKIAPKNPLPVFFVSVASKGFSFAVSLLFATVFISVAPKGLRARVRGDPDRVGAGEWEAVSREKNW